MLVTVPLLTLRPSCTKLRALISQVLSILSFEYLDDDQREGPILEEVQRGALAAATTTPRCERPTDRRRTTVPQDLLKPRP